MLPAPRHMRSWARQFGRHRLKWDAGSFFPRHCRQIFNLFLNGKPLDYAWGVSCQSSVNVLLAGETSRAVLQSGAPGLVSGEEGELEKSMGKLPVEWYICLKSITMRRGSGFLPEGIPSV